MQPSSTEIQAAGHPVARRILAEELVRLRRSDERRRALASQRSGRVDANPHQIDAVVFALGRLQQGGCILADEVGLGKTIEAGLVIAQLQAEGAQRILLLTPKPLLGQWKQELEALFGMTTSGRTGEAGSFAGPGVFLVGREFAGSEGGSQALAGSGRFDLCVIDEAHELFAGIYRRYDRRGRIRDRSSYAKLAMRVKALISDTPVVLLTATPIQNSLAELWGLVQYVEPTGTLLGDLPTFRTLFCADDDRRVRAGAEDELKQRIAQVCQRTLRRQAEAFMERPFSRRCARIFEYAMSPAERELYDDVTAYLMRPTLCAFRGSHRRLLLIGFHRRMGSSVAALAASLSAVAERLRRRLREPQQLARPTFDPDPDRADDLEEDDEDPVDASALDHDEGPPPADTALAAELREVEALAARARGLSRDSKAEALCEAVAWVRQAGDDAAGTGKVVIFTEALSTQEALRERLIVAGVVGPDDITLFRGNNSGASAARALQRWQQHMGTGLPPGLSRDVATRLALVHEFATRSSVFISTEAGAKGLNLQFCENVVNYDLPWNPQRIEQRIGRCHRYGQTRTVTVVNFLARDNEAQRLVLEILSRKLELFGTILDASDAVLYEPTGPAPEVLAGALGLQFETRMREIYEQARSSEQIAQGLAALDDAMGRDREGFVDTRLRTAGIIETRLDETVRAAFRSIETALPGELAAFDAELKGVVVRYLAAIGVDYRLRPEADGGERLSVSADERLPPPYRDGLEVSIGEAAVAGADRLHLGHGLIAAAIEEARQSTRALDPVRVAADLPEFQGARGRAAVLKVHFGGYDPAVEIVPVVVVEGKDDPVFGAPARALLVAAMGSVAAVPLAVDQAALDDACEEAMFVVQAEIDASEQRLFDAAIERIERHIDDRILVLARSRSDLGEQLVRAKQARDAAISAVPRTLAETEGAQLAQAVAEVDAEIARLAARDDDAYQTWHTQALQRRFTPPRIERLFEVEFVVR